jgi:hypothetical protein
MKRVPLCLAALLVVALTGAQVAAEPAVPSATSAAQPPAASAPAVAPAAVTAAVAPTAVPSTAAVPAAPPATASPASRDPRTPSPTLADLEGAIFLSGPPCTYYECIQGCSDCPAGQGNYCISTAHCQCGCR